MSLLLPNSLLPISWLTEERPDKHRRRRICLGCGESFEYPVKSVPAMSFVAWIKAHLPCGEFYSPSIEFYGAAAEETAASVASLPKASLPEAGLPECPQCGFVGVYLHPSGVCTECEKAAIAAYCATLPQEPVQEENREEDPRIAVFMERTGCTREEVQSMIDKGLITLRVSEELVTRLRGAASVSGEAAFVTNERPAPKLAPPVPPLNPAGDPWTFADPCTFTTKPGPLLRRGNVKQIRTKKGSDLKKKPEMMLT